MKQLLFLLLFPCLALAQYPGNENQKITLGEQTTADGLVFRGVANIDTVTATSKITRANKQDTSAFLLLDTVTNLLWHYKTGSNGWTQAGGSTFDTTTLNLTTRFAAKQNNITLTTTGTSGAATFSPVTATLNIPNYTITNPVTGTGTTNYLPKFTGTSTIGNSVIQESSTNIGIGGTPTHKLDIFTSDYIGQFIKSTYLNSSIYYSSTLIGYNKTANQSTEFGYAYNSLTPLESFTYLNTFGNAQGSQFALNASGNVGIGTASPTEKLHVVGNARITAVGTASSSNTTLYITNNGTLSTNISDVNKKHNIRTLPYGLSAINSLKPVAFDWNESDETDIGFIAQDIENVIPESVITNWDSQLIFRQEKIIPVLVKAIQEQQNLIKALEQRILILENK